MLGLFDIGGTHIRIGIAKNFDAIEKTLIVRTPQNFDEGVDLLIKSVEDLLNGEKITALAGGIAGPLNKEKSMVVNAPNLPLWNNQPLSAALSKAFGNIPVFLENDAALGGLGEAVSGAGKGYDIVAYVAAGTGLGGVRIVDKKIDVSMIGFEPGHQIIGNNKREDVCGKLDHLEAYVGGKYIKQHMGKAPEDITDPIFWEDIAHYLAIGLNNTIVHWSPSIVVIAGSVGQHIPLEKVQEEIDRILTIYPTKPKIVRESLGKFSGIYGALALIQGL